MLEIHREGLHTENVWERGMQDEDFFQRQTEYANVSIELRRRLYDAVANVPGRPQVERDIFDSTHI